MRRDGWPWVARTSQHERGPEYRIAISIDNANLASCRHVALPLCFNFMNLLAVGLCGQSRRGQD